MRRGGIFAATSTLAMTLGWAHAAGALVYPTNTCVQAKQQAAAAYCRTTINAWKAWEHSQNNTSRDFALTNAAAKLADKWSKAEANALKKNIDCSVTTGLPSDVQSLVDAGVGTLVTDVNTGLTLANTKHAACGAALLGAAATDCSALLTADSRLVVNTPRKASVWAYSRTKHDADQAKARANFVKAFITATAPPKVCPTTATTSTLQTDLDTLDNAVVLNTTTAPALDNTQFTAVSFGATETVTYLKRDYTPKCMDSSAYTFFVKRGTVNKLVMYYEGGGACWEQLTCGGVFPIPATCTTSVDPTPPSVANSGFADLTNPANPFKDWNIVFVPYCSCDIHYGDAAQDYSNIDPAHPKHVEHRGFHNAKVAEKYAREHFVNPDVVFVTGSSAGAYGALFHGAVLHDVWPAATIRVLGDAGNGVITSDFLQNEFPNWNFTANLPAKPPGVLQSITNGTGMVGYIEAVAAFYPATNWAHYATAFDGGFGGQTGFYNIMLHGNNPVAALTWWQGSCAFNTNMVSQAQDTFTTVSGGTNNYRYYIGSGSRHTMWGSNKVYTDTLGGVPLIADWINAMLGTNDPNWVNVTANPFNVLLPGDPRPPDMTVPVTGGTAGSTSLTVTGTLPSGFPSSGTITSITNGAITTPEDISFTRSGSNLTLSASLPSAATAVTVLAEPFEPSGSDIIVNCP